MLILLIEQISFSAFLFTVFAAVNFFLLVGQYKDVWKLLLNGSDAAGIPAFDDVFDLFWQTQISFLNDLAVLDHIDGDVMVDKTENIDIQCIDITLHLQDILFSFFIAARIFDDRNCTIQFIKLEKMLDRQAFACFNMIQYKALLNFSYI